MTLLTNVKSVRSEYLRSREILGRDALSLRIKPSHRGEMQSSLDDALLIIILPIGL